MIRLYTLGALDLRGADGPEIRPILAQPKRLALLAYLAVQGREAFSRRGQMIALLWPERDHEGAGAALDGGLPRRALGDGVLLLGRRFA
jgi:DNA-binding SARP family transcriptional activator